MARDVIPEETTCLVRKGPSMHAVPASLSLALMITASTPRSYSKWPSAGALRGSRSLISVLSSLLTSNSELHPRPLTAR
jgi:hypothetical protein